MATLHFGKRTAVALAGDGTTFLRGAAGTTLQTASIPWWDPTRYSLTVRPFGGIARDFSNSSPLEPGATPLNDYPEEYANSLVDTDGGERGVLRRYHDGATLTNPYDLARA